MRRDVKCSLDNGEELESAACKGQEKPQAIQACNKGDCIVGAEWKKSSWTKVACYSLSLSLMILVLVRCGSNSTNSSSSRSSNSGGGGGGGSARHCDNYNYNDLFYICRVFIPVFCVLRKRNKIQKHLV